jgi:tRNA pseudouridine-54 N-methylase
MVFLINNPEVFVCTSEVVGMDIKQNQMIINMSEHIEQLKAELQKTVNERNAAWFQLEEAGIEINAVRTNEDAPYVVIESESGLTPEGEQSIRESAEKVRSILPVQEKSRATKE